MFRHDALYSTEPAGSWGLNHTFLHGTILRAAPTDAPRARRRAEPGKTMGSGVWLNVIGDYKPLVGDGLQTAIGVVGSAYGLKQRQRHLGRKTKKPKNREGKNRKNRGKTGKKPGKKTENRGKPGTVTNYPLFLRTPTTLAGKTGKTGENRGQ